MLEIALIDDKSYGLKHIEKIHVDIEFNLDYFSSFREFEAKMETNKKFFDIIYLDYFLDKDGITGDLVLSEVKKYTKKVIGFSSVQKCSERLKKAGADEALEKIFY